MLVAGRRGLVRISNVRDKLRVERRTRPMCARGRGSRHGGASPDDIEHNVHGQWATGGQDPNRFGLAASITHYEAEWLC
jgi:hypothetical protein